jgi:RNA polymerase sigma-70 factor (ECF subfamily)
VDRAVRGDSDAWEELYRRAYPKMLAYARARLDPEGAKDAVAETMTRAVGSIHRYRWEGRSVDAWLFGILRHVITDVHRSQGRSRHVPEGGLGAAAGPLDEVVAAEEHGAVRTAFALLSGAEREVLELRVVAGLSADEVAKVLGRKPGAVRMAQSRALARLRELLADAGFDGERAMGGAS